MYVSVSSRNQHVSNQHATLLTVCLTVRSGTDCCKDYGASHRNSCCWFWFTQQIQT